MQLQLIESFVLNVSDSIQTIVTSTTFLTGSLFCLVSISLMAAYFPCNRDSKKFGIKKEDNAVLRNRLTLREENIEIRSEC